MFLKNLSVAALMPENLLTKNSAFLGYFWAEVILA